VNNLVAENLQLLHRDIIAYVPNYTLIEKTSWNNSNTVLVIQRRGRVVTDYKNHPKVFLIALQCMSISQLPPKVWVRSFRPFLNRKKNSS